MIKKQFLFVLLFSVLILSTRFLSLPANFTPIFGWALFMGAFLGKNKWSLALPIALFIGIDLVVGFHSGAIAVWACFLVIMLASSNMVKNENLKWLRVLTGAVLGPVFFFLVTNFEVWMFSGMYPITFEGLTASYVAGLPFYAQSAQAALIFTPVFFGAWVMAKKYGFSKYFERA